MDAPKMSRKQAKILWNSLSMEQKREFNEMYGHLLKGELTLNHVAVDDNEQIQRIVLEPKEKPSIPDKPFYQHFK